MLDHSGGENAARANSQIPLEKAGGFRSFSGACHEIEGGEGASDERVAKLPVPRNTLERGGM